METDCSEEMRGSNSSKEFVRSDAKGGRFDMGRLDKAVPLYHRVLSALIEEHDCDEYYHQSEAKHMFLQSASDDSHCGSCNLNDYEHRDRDRDRVESEAESTIDFQIPKNNMFDRFSCDKSAMSNSYRNPSMSSFIQGGEQLQGEDDLSHCDVGHAGEICSNDSFQLQSLDFNVSNNVFPNCQYQMMRLNDKLLLELQSIGLYPETLVGFFYCSFTLRTCRMSFIPYISHICVLLPLTLFSILFYCSLIWPREKISLTKRLWSTGEACANRFALIYIELVSQYIYIY